MKVHEQKLIKLIRIFLSLFKSGALGKARQSLGISSIKNVTLKLVIINLTPPSFHLPAQITDFSVVAAE